MNEENLNPWKRGQSGNPADKLKGTRNRSTIVREMIETAAAEAPKGKIDLGLNP